MARIADFQVPSSPRTTFNVGRIGGGTSINAIASEAWMEVDLRSGDTASLRALEKQFRQAVNEAVAAGECAMEQFGADGVDRNRRHASRGTSALVGPDRPGRDLGLESLEPSVAVFGGLDRRESAAQPRDPGGHD